MDKTTVLWCKIVNIIALVLQYVYDNNNSGWNEMNHYSSSHHRLTLPTSLRWEVMEISHWIRIWFREKQKRIQVRSGKYLKDQVTQWCLTFSSLLANKNPDVIVVRLLFGRDDMQQKYLVGLHEHSRPQWCLGDRFCVYNCSALTKISYEPLLDLLFFPLSVSVLSLSPH